MMTCTEGQVHPNGHDGTLCHAASMLREELRIRWPDLKDFRVIEVETDTHAICKTDSDPFTRLLATLVMDTILEQLFGVLRESMMRKVTGFTLRCEGSDIRIVNCV